MFSQLNLPVKIKFWNKMENCIKNLILTLMFDLRVNIKFWIKSTYCESNENF